MIDPRFYRSLGAQAAGTLAGGAELVGDGARLICGVAEFGTAGPDDMTFFDAKGLPPSTAAGLLFVGPGVNPPADFTGTLARCTFPRAAFARAANLVLQERPWADGAHAIAESAVMEADVRCGPGAVIGEDARIGSGAIIGPGCVIGPGVTIGRRSRLGPNVSIQCALIGDDVTIHAGVSIGQPGFGVTHGEGGLVDLPHFGRVIIQDGATIGANCTIDRGMLRDTVIAEQVKLDNLCHIAHNVILGRQVRIAAFGGVSGSTTVGDRALMAGRVGIIDHATVGADAILAAGSAVLHDVPAGEVWCGYPAKPRMQWLREVAWLAKASRKRNGDSS